MSLSLKEFYARNSRILRPLAWVVGIVLFLHGALFLSADFLLRSYLKEKVFEASEGKYAIEFEKFRISLLQRGFSFRQLTLMPLTDSLEFLSEIPFYQAELPYFSIKGINYHFRSKELILGNIQLKEPDLRVRFLTQEGEKNEASPLILLQEEIQKSFLSSTLKDIRIKNLEVLEADFLINNFISQRAIRGENSRIYLKDVQLLQNRVPETPFNAEGFEFSMEQFEILLADSVHRISSSLIDISSLQAFIKASKIQIEPNFSKPLDSYFQLELDQLSLAGADINKLFYTGVVDINFLNVQRPYFQLYSTPKRQEIDLGEFDLYQLIEGILEEINIQDLQIEEGKFTKRNTYNRHLYSLHSERVNFKMNQVYVGPDNSRKQDQFFYATDASLDLFDVDVYLGDSLHRVTGDVVRLSSYEDEVQINGFQLGPLEGKLTSGGNTLLEIAIPEFRIAKANLKKIYQEGIIQVEELMIDQPTIVLRDVQNKEDGAAFDIASLYEDFLEGIYIQHLELREGSLVVDNNLRSRQDSLSFGTINLSLDNFALDAATVTSESRGIFWADDMRLEFKDYALKLSDDLHMFSADRVLIDTKLDRVSIRGFRIQPFDQERISTILDRYDKSTTLDIFVPEFTAIGLDIFQAYDQGILKVRRIDVPSPTIKIHRHRSQQDSEEEKVQRDVLELLTSYFESISIGALNVQRGSLSYENSVRERMRTFSEENISITVKNFYVDRATEMEGIASLFSEEVDLSLNNYVFSVANGKYNIVADRINFNTSTEEIITRNVRLTPSSTTQDKTKISATIPSLSFRGVDLEAFLFDNVLQLQKVRLLDSEVLILINKDIETEGTELARRARRRDRGLPKTIERISIDTVLTEQSRFSLSFKEGGNTSNLINTGINLGIYDFELDSTRAKQADIASLFGALSLEMDEFWLNLPDSMHQITFEKVELDTRRDGVLVSNFRIIPNALSGNPGKPIFSGQIPVTLIKINSLSELQQSKDLWIRELTLFRPDLEIFTDTIRNLKRVKDPRDAVKEIILESLQVDDFKIEQGNIALMDKNGVKPSQTLKGLDLFYAGFVSPLEDLEHLTVEDLVKDEFSIFLPSYEVLMKDSLNRMRVRGLSIQNNRIRVESLDMLPTVGRFQYHRKVGFQSDVAEIYLEDVEILYPQWKELLEEERLKAHKISIGNVDARIFRDKRFPKKEGIIRPMPQLLMQQAGIEAYLDTLIIQQAYIGYTEFPEKGMIPGNIYFSDLQASFMPFVLARDSSDFSLEKSDVYAKAFLNGVAPIDLQARMYYSYPYPMDVNVQLGAFDLMSINSIVEANAFAKVQRGRIDGGNWSFIAHDDYAVGNMTLLYSDLRVQLLDERTLQAGKGRKKILTFVLNAFAVNSNNPRKLSGRTVRSRIYEERDREKFIFNYWWKTSLSGVKGSLGLGQPTQPKRKED
ncbi:hypothetical protein [Mongoliitalea daihaiensis]|uniref:hypothetical protein n=1 Tax=Mongoliitalea daihaiensis TaxID=2782006 RepID=UPI001F2E2EA0|nr:hypothetical protein [Mongoliitalea daihaiensis]UJP66506.1 hypothetical protein IPZ59_07880 [Mongoliitalea daihaiensis]